MLSSQTKDEITSATINFLIFEKNLSVDTIMNTSEEELNQWIAKVGFHNKKAVYIKKTTKILKEEYGGFVPNDLKKLLSFPGVGPKMAHLVLQSAFG